MTDRWTDRQTDRQTDARVKTICLPTLSGGDINSKSAASEPPEKWVPLSPDAEKQEHEKAILQE